MVVVVVEDGDYDDDNDAATQVTGWIVTGWTGEIKVAVVILSWSGGA